MTKFLSNPNAREPHRQKCRNHGQQMVKYKHRQYVSLLKSLRIEVMKESDAKLLAKRKQIRLLSDLPLTADKERDIRFGHLSIVDNLRKLVLACPTPFTIGLFGRWGTGKTTILEFLPSKLRADGIAVVKFDIWKHEGDSLRRTFLRETTKQLTEAKCLHDFELSERLDARVSRTFQGGFKFRKSIIVPVCLTLIAVGFLISRIWPANLGTYLSIVFGGGLVGLMVMRLLQQAITTETLTVATDRLEDPHEFETEFKRIVSKVAAKKLLIIIDNLDRASHEKAVELMSTVKTFLEQEKCIFLMACDAEAIKKHLEVLYVAHSENMRSFQPFDSDEFLRKFFNACIRIPDFIDTELQSYTEDLLRETNISGLDSSDVAYVITAAFRDNPRQIKQFINTLVAHFLLAEERETVAEPLIVPRGIVTNNAAYLAKCLIIQQYFAKYYDRYMAGESIKSTEDKRLGDFLRATRPVHVDDSRPFHYLKLSEEELGMPDLKDLQLAMQDHETELVQEKIKSFQTDPQQLAKFNRFILSFIDRNRGRGLILYNVVSSTLSALQLLGLELTKHFYNDIADLLNDDATLGARLHNFDPRLIFAQVLSRCIKYHRGGVIARYTGLLSNPEHIDSAIYDRETYIKVLLKELVDHKDWLDSARKSEIRDAIAKKHCSYDTLSMFMGKTDEQREFVSEETLNTFIADISAEDVEAPENIRPKVDLLLDFKGIVNDKNLAQIITQFTAILQTENTKPYRKEKEDLLACFDDFIGTFGTRVANLQQDVVDSFADAVLKGINALGPWEQKRVFVPTALGLADLLAEPLKSQISSVLKAFFTSVNPDSLDIVFDTLRTKNKKQELIEQYESVLRQRALNDQRVFDSLYPLATKDTRTKWLVNLTQVDHQRAVTKLKQLNYRVGDGKTVISAIMKKVNIEVPLRQREDLLNVCSKMKCANDVELKATFVSHIKSCLRDASPDAQRMGLTILRGVAWLPDTQKRDIAIDTVEWLRSLQPDAAGQAASAQSVLVNWNILPDAVQRDFVDFVFDKLIRRGANADNVRLGFEILHGIEPGPRYDDSKYSSYFEDALSRVESEGDSQIKHELIEGLLLLKPAKLNARSRSFWNRVERSKT